MNRLIPMIAVAALMLAGCKQNAADTAKDVANAQETAGQNTDAARQEASKTVAKANDQVADAKQVYDKTDASAHKKLSAAESDAMVKTAKADFDVATTEAEGRHDVAKEKCDALSGVDKDSCLSTANALLASDQATATAKRDAAFVDADHHE
jgi:vacuolar-type H+-ATPase subunit H